MKRFSHQIHLFAMLVCLALTACGGNGSNSPTPMDADSQVTKMSTIVADASGANLIGTDIYDLIADLGDTWRITLNRDNSTFDLQVIQTVYGLSATQGTLTVGETLGTRTTYTLQSGTTAIGTLTVDSSTRTVAGNLRLGSQSASVSGTAYKATILAKLAGTYNFMQATRNANAHSNLDFGVGQVKISDDGRSAQLCRSGKFIGNNCASVGGSTPVVTTLMLSLDANGRVIFQGFGLASVVASDLGKSMIIDMARINEEYVARTGVFYLSESKVLKENVINGNWFCSKGGAATNSLYIAGTNGSGQGLGPVTAAKFSYNQVNHTDNSWIAFDGFAAGGATTDPVSDYSIILPLSSTLMVMESDLGASICHKTKNT